MRSLAFPLFLFQRFFLYAGITGLVLNLWQLSPKLITWKQPLKQKDWFNSLQFSAVFDTVDYYLIETIFYLSSSDTRLFWFCSNSLAVHSPPFPCAASPLSLPGMRTLQTFLFWLSMLLSLYIYLGNLIHIDIHFVWKIPPLCLQLLTSDIPPELWLLFLIICSSTKTLNTAG